MRRRLVVIFPPQELSTSAFFHAGATSISAALDEIDEVHLLPAMARLEQHRVRSAENQGGGAAEGSTSMAHNGPAVEGNAAKAKFTSTPLGDAPRAQVYDEECRGSHGTSLTISASSVHDEYSTNEDLATYGSARSSDSTCLPHVILEHFGDVNHCPQHGAEAVHESYLDHAKKLGSLLVSALLYTLSSPRALT